MNRYYCLARPPTYANYPDREQKPAALEVWMPGRRIPCEATGDRRALGWVDYEKPLSLDTVRHWSLWPADRVEQAELAFFREGEIGASLRAEFAAMSIEELQALDSEVWLRDEAIVLKEAGRA